MPNFKKTTSGGGPSAMKMYGKGKNPIKFMDSDTRPAKSIDPETGLHNRANMSEGSPTEMGSPYKKQYKPLNPRRPSRGRGDRGYKGMAR